MEEIFDVKKKNEARLRTQLSAASDSTNEKEAKGN